MVPAAATSVSARAEGTSQGGSITAGPDAPASAAGGGGGRTTASSSFPTEIHPMLPDEHQRVDDITALQDGIDSLSLAMFEALRGLRDAVAPESGNLGTGQQNNEQDGGNSNGNNDATNESPLDTYEDFWQAYRAGDPEIVAEVRRVSPTPPTKNADYIRIHSRLEMEKDAVLVSKLAKTVLEKSAIIDQRVSSIRGVHRTKAEQMMYMEQLLEHTQQADEKLAEAYQRAEERREAVLKFVMENAHQALGIEEE